MSAAEPTAGQAAEGRPFPNRLEHFDSVDSTQRVVREWLEAATPEVAVAIAGHQSAGRGRQGRVWQAPPGAALLLSIGFRPPSLAARHAWRLAATVSLAMLDAAEEAAGLKDDTLWLKWPNDIVADAPDGRLVKVAGVLGESTVEGERVDTAVIGIGVNVDWAANDFPRHLAPSMSSLRELAGGRPVERAEVLASFLARLEPRYEALTAGTFDAGGWSRRQRTTGRQVEVEAGAGRITGRAIGVDPESGALLLEIDGRRRPIGYGEVTRCRIIDAISSRPV